MPSVTFAELERMAAHPNETITVGAGQMVAQPLSRADKALAAVERLVRRAAGRRADLLVLPECAYPAYVLDSPERYRSADVLPPAEFLRHVASMAREFALHIVTGHVEEDGDRLYNAASVIDRHGMVLGTYRKQLLWDVDHDTFCAGEAITPVDTELGRVGMLICADARVPEIPATLAAAGAQLIAMPTAWVRPDPRNRAVRNPQPEFLIESRAREFAIPFVCANKAGAENDRMAFCGQSRITRADGTTTAEAAEHGESLIVSRIVVQPARRVWMVESRRQRLLAEPAGPEATPDDSRPFTVEVVPRSVIEPALESQAGDYLASLGRRGVRLLVSNFRDERDADALVQNAALHEIAVVAFPSSSRIRNLAVGRVGQVAGQAGRSFASSRALALEGAEILCLLAPTLDMATLRTRAIENRVYVLAAGIRSAAIIDPNGAVVAETDLHRPHAISATIDPATTADKYVAPRTDIFRHRKPSAYRF